MALATTQAIALLGLEGHLADVEADLSDGLPRFSLIGVPDATLAEARDRVRSAILNAGEKWPDRRITVALSPAWLPKRGSAFDLAVAVAILVAQGAIPRAAVERTVFIGELALDGRVRAVHGVLPAVHTARTFAIEKVVVPVENAAEAALVSGIEVIAVDHLSTLLRHLRGEQIAAPILGSPIPLVPDEVDFSDVVGHAAARRALEIAAAGRHHVLMIGSPGAGKTMLAHRLTTILPPLSHDQALEVSSIHSVAGVLSAHAPLVTTPPFIAPHHTATRTSIVGGGSGLPRPGAVSLAHHGVLFIDEAPECASGVLDALRQPLESAHVTVSRTAGTARYPADVTLVLAANPCPCGRYGSRQTQCSCTPSMIRRYLGRLSGPLLDRIDLHLAIEPVSRMELAEGATGESSEVIRTRVQAAQERAVHRWGNLRPSTTVLRRDHPADPKAMEWLHAAVERSALSTRSMLRILRLAWSITDLRAGHQPAMDDIAEALTLRMGASEVLAA